MSVPVIDQVYKRPPRPANATPFHQRQDQQQMQQQQEPRHSVETPMKQQQQAQHRQQRNFNRKKTEQSFDTTGPTDVLGAFCFGFGRDPK